MDMFPVHGEVVGRVSGRVGIQEGRAYTEGVVGLGRQIGSEQRYFFDLCLSLTILFDILLLKRSSDLVFTHRSRLQHPTALMRSLSTDTNFCYRRGRRYLSSDSLRQFYLSAQLYPLAVCRLQSKTPAGRCNWRLM
jgi:hypothetical protein